MAYPEGLLTSGERVREHWRPHVRMLAVPAVVPPVVAGVAAWAAAMLARVSWHPVAWLALVVLGVAVVLRFSLLPLLSWWCTHFVVTDRRLLVREGIVSRSDVDVPGSSIVEIRTSQRAVERMLGCGTLQVATRDAPDDPWEFHGLPRLTRTATRLEEVADEHGGLDDPEDLDELDDPDDLEDLDDWDDPEPVEERADGWDRTRISRSRGRRPPAGRTSR